VHNIFIDSRPAFRRIEAGSTARSIPMVRPTKKTCTVCSANWPKLALIPRGKIATSIGIVAHAIGIDLSAISGAAGQD
jgi:hypothetical protein